MNEKTIRGLLIEDDPEDTALLIKLLAKTEWPTSGFSFVCSEQLHQAFEVLEKETIEVILLDLMLPDSQGIETLLKLRAKCPDVPIVVLTGLQDEKMGLEAMQNGAQDYQIKGNIDAHAFKRTISYAVERHRVLASLRRILDRAPDGMIIVDHEGLTQYFNQSARQIFDGQGELLLHKPFPYSLSEDRPGEWNVDGPNGSTRIVEVRVTEISWRDQPARLASVRDITELRRIEQIKAEIGERRRMDKLKDDLMNAVSHEMRNPLAIIKAATSNLRDGMVGRLSLSQAKMVVIQYKHVQWLEKILSRILDLARLESGKAQINIEPLDAINLVRRSVRAFRLVAGKRNILVQQELPAELPFIDADPDMFSQVLANLLDNALRFAKSRIVVKAGVATNMAGHVVFSVSDDGDGVPADKVSELFNKFVQVQRRADRSHYKGTGLGLALCKEIVERQGGRIWASVGAGEGGARFEFALPFAGAATKSSKRDA